MTANDIFTALVDINEKMLNQCKAKIDAVSKDNKTELKALYVERGMYEACLRIGSLYKSVDNWEAFWNIRKGAAENMLLAYPSICKTYMSAIKDGNEVFMAATHAEMFIRNQLYEGLLAEVKEATLAEDSKKRFELNINVKAMENVFDAWEDWRVKNNIFPGVFKCVSVSGVTASEFFKKAYDAMEAEILKLDNVSKDEGNIAEYKCARYRYAGLVNIQVCFYQCFRLKNSLGRADYLSPHIEDALRKHPEYEIKVTDAESKWYYGMLAYADEAISELEPQMPDADDWEKVELENRIEGLILAKKCLEVGWNER